MANIKISQLQSINGNLTSTAQIPIVSTNGTLTTDKITVSNLANYILGDSGNLFVNANIANLAYDVINASQPNITTIGTLTNLTVTGTTTLGYPDNVVILGGDVGQVLGTVGEGLLGWVDQIGPVGATGVEGPTGATGIQGATGPEGPPGPATTQGATGATGPGFVWTGPWNPSGYYIGGQDVVSYAGSSYIKIGDGNSGSAPPDDPIRWSVMAEEGAVGAVGATGSFSGTFTANVDANGFSISNAANIQANYFEGVATDVQVTGVNNNYSYHMAFVTGPGDTTLHLDSDDDLQYNPADGILTVNRIDPDYLNVHLNVISDLIPFSNVAYDLGNSSSNWRRVYANTILSNSTITISSDALDWTFDTDGALNLPANGTVRGNYLNMAAAGFSQLQWLDSGNLNIPDPNGTNGPTNWVYVESGGVYIETNKNTELGNTVRTWNFDLSGNLTVPGNIQAINTGFAFSSNITGITTGSSTVVVELQDNPFPDPVTGQVQITGVLGTTEANNTWWYQAVETNAFQLYTDSTLSTPVDGTTWTAYISGGLAVCAGYNDISIRGGNVSINSGVKTWTFNDYGSTIFPILNVDLHNGGNQQAQTLQFGDTEVQAVITGPTPSANVNAQRLIIQGQRGNGTYGEGGDVYVWAGDADTNGGDIKIYAGDADVSGYGGYINLDGGSGVNGGGQITITGGQSSGGVGGQITITPGYSGDADGATLSLNGGQAVGNGGGVNITAGYGQANGGQVTITGGQSALGLPGYGNVVIQAGASSWTFDNAGILNLPGGTGTIESYANNISIYSDAGQYNGALFYDTGAEIYALQDFAIFTDNANTSHIWRFYANGNMLAPGAINVGNMSIGALPGYITADANTGIILNTSGSDGGFVVDYLKEDGNANTSGGELAFNSELGDTTYRISLSNDMGNGFATKIWRFDGTGNLTLPTNAFTVNYANGTPVSIGGGSGNTGNVTFDNVTVQGVNGLNLSAGSDFTANLAYLQVRAGDVASHIHLDTGNNEAYDLIVGDDQNYVQVSSTGNILLSSYDSNTAQYTWTLDYNGNLILAGGNSVIQSIANSSLDPLNPNVSTMVLTPDSGYGSQALVLDPTTVGHIHLRSPGSTIDQPSANLFLGGEASSFEVGQFNGAVPNLFIHSNNNTWTFDIDGNLTLPQHTTISDESEIGTTLTVGVPPTVIVISGADFSSVNLTYNKDGANSLWYPAGYNPSTDPYIEFTGGQYGIFVPGFGQALYVNTGTLNVPLAQWNTNPPLGSVAPTAVYTYGALGPDWVFGTDGTLTLPGEGIIQSINDTVILRSVDSNSNIYSARLGTNGGLYFETTAYPTGWLSLTNNSGNANITAATGTAGGAGKHIIINAGDADQSDYYTSAGGNINIKGGLGAFNDGGGGGPGGSINIFAGNSSDPAGHAGNINITSGSKAWTFDYTGNLQVAGDVFANTGASPAPALYGFSSLQVFDQINVGGIIITSADGSNGQVLTTYGNGVTYWSTVSGGGSYGDSNVVTLLGSFGSNSISTTGNVTANNFSGNTNGYTLGYLNIPQVSASNTTLALSDAGKHYYSTTAGNLTLTIPLNSSVAFPTGTAISIVVQAAGNVLVNAAAGVTLYMAGSSTAGNRVVGTYGMATLMKVASDTWFINGTGVY